MPNTQRWQTGTLPWGFQTCVWPNVKVVFHMSSVMFLSPVTSAAWLNLCNLLNQLQFLCSNLSKLGHNESTAHRVQPFLLKLREELLTYVSPRCVQTPLAWHWTGCGSGLSLGPDARPPPRRGGSHRLLLDEGAAGRDKAGMRSWKQPCEGRFQTCGVLIMPLQSEERMMQEKLADQLLHLQQHFQEKHACRVVFVCV